MVAIDLKPAVHDSVSEGLKKAGQEDTPANRYLVLMDLHTALSIGGNPQDAPIIDAIEQLVIDLDDEVHSK